ncbi:MAG: RluA family pseudouridine synthase [Myxococcales bacterium]|nr:RluA family pseudouridine synthase [Myxococcales bacterium]
MSLRKHVLRVAVGDPGALAPFLALRLGLPAGEVERWVDLGAVQVDGRRAQAVTRLAPGAQVVAREPAKVGGGEPRLKVAWRDDVLLVVDKPPGMLSQPSQGEASSSVEVLVRREHPDARPMHRLDRDASGLLLVALRPDAYAALQHSLDRGEIAREYLAVAAGKITEPQQIRLKIARDPADSRRRLALPERAPGGQSARTHIVPVAAAAGGTLIRVTLDTGRTHQIRVHLAALGHPLVGDRLYGGPAAPRLMLHAARLAFPHPQTAAPIEVVSAIAWS